MGRKTKVNTCTLDAHGSTSVPARAPPHAADSLNPSGFDVQGGLNPSGFDAQSAAGPPARPSLQQPAGAKAALSRAAGSSHAPGRQPSSAAGRYRSRTPAPVPSTYVPIAQQPLTTTAPPSNTLPVQPASYTDFRDTVSPTMGGPVSKQWWQRATQGERRAALVYALQRTLSTFLPNISFQEAEETFGVVLGYQADFSILARQFIDTACAGELASLTDNCKSILQFL